MPGRLVMETGGFWGMIAACPKPVLGLPYSFVRLPPLFRGPSPLAWLGPHSSQLGCRFQLRGAATRRFEFGQSDT
jgi:hypothetical protein